ncbi:MAG TPA: trehalose-phosphatase [Acidimicrobiia bacterium]|nr:trehalose-phosphatase [Acidimicrobiia bacterium]
MIEDLATAARLLVASDFDGTLAEIVDDPDLAIPLARSKSALEDLAGLTGTTVAIISGRRRSELIERFGHPGFILIGEHGADHGVGTGPESPALAAARLLAEDMARATPGARVEHKTRSVGFHYRQVEEPDQTLSALRLRAAAIEGLRIVEGKKIIELTDSPMSKGAALAELKTSLAAPRVLFMGDDVTDETAFAVLDHDDIGVHVGVGPTLADHIVADPFALADLLDTILTLRAGRMEP